MGEKSFTYYPNKVCVFIDTCVYRNHGLRFEDQFFEQLVKFAEKSSVLLINIGIVDLEVEKRIDEMAESFRKFASNIRKNCAGIKDLGELNEIQGIFDKSEHLKIKEELNNSFKKFKERARVLQIDYSGVEVEKIVNSYFKKEPPFGNGGKEKEFPDAIIMAALEEFCKKNAQEIYVISTDNDMKKYCETSECLIHVSGLRTFIDGVNRYDERYYDILKFINHIERKSIENLVGEQVSWLDIDLDNDGVVLKIKLVEIIMDEEPQVTSINHKECSVSIAPNLRLELDVEYGNPDTHIPPHIEEGQYGTGVYREMVNTTIDLEMEMLFEIKLDYDSETGKYSISDFTTDQGPIYITEGELRDLSAGPLFRSPFGLPF